jgi:ribonuclease T2
MRYETVLLFAALLLLDAACAAVSNGGGGISGRCMPTNDLCWPSAADVAHLEAALSDGNRTLYWPGGDAPRPCSVPLDSPFEQPLYGAGVFGLPKVSVTSLALLNNASTLCYEGGNAGGCMGAIVNNPLHGWKPAFVVWPLTSGDVQLAVSFAARHNLCIMVAGTGHDFLNRHSCPSGVLIRTALMKEQTFLPQRSTHGAFRFGPGITFSEAHYTAAGVDRVVSSGWASTVGIIGWSTGGGHGPFAPAYGLGVDNVLEIEVATSPTGYGAGAVLTVNETHHADLFAALRGGGGSTWGVVTAITVRAHPIPTGGFTVARVIYVGGFCNDFNDTAGIYGADALRGLIPHAFNWMAAQQSTMGGLSWWWGTPTSDPRYCGANWTVLFDYVYLGPSNATDLISSIANLTAAGPSGLVPSPIFAPSYTNYANWYEYVSADLEPIMPFPWLEYPAPNIGGIPSVLVRREQLLPPAQSDTAAVLYSFLVSCAQNFSSLGRSACNRAELYQDITGNIGSPQPDGLQSLNAGMRAGVLHWVSGSNLTTAQVDRLYSLGEFSYFGESAATIRGTHPNEGTPAWGKRLWGDETYRRLKQAKQKWDPQQPGTPSVFWCHYCVGDDAE